MREAEHKEINGKWNKYKRKQKNKKQRHEKQGYGKPTNATLSIHNNVVFVPEDGENDREKLGVLRIGEAIEPTISLEIVTTVFKVWGPDIENIIIMHEHLDEELASLQEM